MVTSALPPKADMCGATRDVCYGPIADIGPTSDEHSDAWQDNPDLGELARLCSKPRAGSTGVAIGAIAVARERP
jgi:hypothetical protein